MINDLNGEILWMNGPAMVGIYSNKMCSCGGLVMTNFGEKWFMCSSWANFFIVEWQCQSEYLYVHIVYGDQCSGDIAGTLS